MNDDDDLVDLLLIDHDLAIGESLQQDHTGIYNLVTINITVTVVCQENFEGPNCTQCTPGFAGPNCDDVDKCLQLNCSGNGHLDCTSSLKDNFPSFFCECNIGYRGRFCEHVDCSTNNCSGNGVCIGSVSRPRGCTCNAGFTGRVCETKIENCSLNLCGEIIHLSFPSFSPSHSYCQSYRVLEVMQYHVNDIRPRETQAIALLVYGYSVQQMSLS